MNTPTEAYNNLTLDSIQQGVINQMNNWEGKTPNSKEYNSIRNRLLFLVDVFNKDLMLIATHCYEDEYLHSLYDRLLTVLSDTRYICDLIQTIDEGKDNLTYCTTDDSYCPNELLKAVTEIAQEMKEADEEGKKLVENLVFMLSEVAYVLEKDKFNTKRSAEGINSYMTR